MNNVLIGGDGWVYYETVAGGQGARPDRAGMNGVHTGMTNTRNTPIEALERSFPLRVPPAPPAPGQRRAGAAAGRRGHRAGPRGAGGRATLSLITERRVFPPWGLDGGGPGAVGENWLLPRR